MERGAIGGMILQASVVYEVDKWPPADEVDVIEKDIEPRQPQEPV
jgi:hypothetical protein